MIPRNVKIGNATDFDAATGCTVILCETGAVAGVDVRGGGPATRETDLLKPENMVQQIHAVVLSGGSAYGLDTASGVMRWLEERGFGFDVGVARVPLVCGASLFDLQIGRADVRPNAAMGYAACEDAARLDERPVPQGNVGAGTGATVGKLLGPQFSTKSGLGYASVERGELYVGALVAVNAAGHVIAEDGTTIAGTRCPEDEGFVNASGCADVSGTAGTNETAGANGPAGASGCADVCGPAGTSACADASANADVGETAAGVRMLSADEAFDRMLDAADAAKAAGAELNPFSGNTTIGCVITNATLTKAQATKVSAMVHDAYARAIKPVHTINDGDTIFTVATGELAADPVDAGSQAIVDTVAVLGTRAMERAIRNAVMRAEPLCGVPAALDGNNCQTCS